MLEVTAKKMNPFKAMGLVIKYEFKNASKKLIPLYVVLLIISIAAGLLQPPMSDTVNELASERSSIVMNEDVDAFTIQQQLRENDIKRGIIYTILYFLLVLYSFAIVFITVFTLSKRFKKSMLGDEAYLNLVLPVTTGEHIWGRLINAIIWIFICMVVIGLSAVLYMIKNGALSFLPELIDIFKNSGFSKLECSLAQFFTILAVNGVVMLLTIILSAYFVHSISHIATKARTLVKVLTVLLCIYLFFKLPNIVLNSFEDLNFLTNMWIQIGTYFILCAVYMTVTQLVFKKKLNLE